MQMSLKSALAAGLVLAGEAMALDRITVKGSKFFFQNGTQFFMKGIAYQQEVGAAGSSSNSTNYIDPLANEEACKRDVPLMAKAGTNSIRTYAIDPTANHDACMKLLSDAGIYVISDLSEPKLSINREDPLWDTALASRYYAVIDELAKYDNVIGFFAGNEVTNDETNTPASAFVKAAVRDTKAHIKQKGYKDLYVGYAANDDPNVRIDIAHYFNCGDVEDAIDFWGYNIYSWCGKSSLQESGYDKQIEFFQNYSVPIFFAEYGCNEVGGADGRIWEETTALYEKEMTDVFSGGIVYMYFQEANDYGLVELNGDEVTVMKNFDNLGEAVNKANPTGISFDSYNPSNKPQQCPGLSSHWRIAEQLPPTPDNTTCDCMEASVSCGPVSSLDEESFGDIFSFICSESPESCIGINANATTGIYGAYSMCSAKQKLAHVLDSYYSAQNQASDACDFEGQAEVKKPSAASSDCKTRLDAAKTVNEAAAKSSPASMSSSGSSSGSSTGSGSSSTGSPTSAATQLLAGAFVAIAAGLGSMAVLL
ncbi:1,3-beta-glucanosyltransferase [Ceratocystis fimbriata CBS 114723]|uniref:1,3-beta-glucanosyltransferase n=1 Tax=Ceratocystis fimbriata CBS 114723 TaxID=1035309 RepID=A0A2C5WQM9_9PEZI|nr:1,3-beta-glucanosyltransferase [Ceratocystis fimbriata CBS 114723]